MRSRGYRCLAPTACKASWGGRALLAKQALPSNSPEMVEEDQSRLARMSRRAVPRFEFPGGSFFGQTAGDQACGYIGTGTLLYEKDSLNLLISAQHNTGALCVRSVGERELAR